MATCFRHTERETGRACTRCGRPACPDCLEQAPVGAHCRDCTRAARPALRIRPAAWSYGQPLLATRAIVALTVAAFAAIGLADGSFTGAGRTSLDLAVFGPAVEHGEWWRLFTSALVHFGPVHLLFNMVVLYQVGLVLEPGAGHARFGLLYVVSVLGGSAGALVVEPDVFTGGASGGVFGVAAAATLVLHRRGVPFSQTAFGPLLLVNLALGFFIHNVSIGGHLGGLVAGLLAAEGMLQARRAPVRWLGVVAAGAVAATAVAVARSVAV